MSLAGERITEIVAYFIGMFAAAHEDARLRDQMNAGEHADGPAPELALPQGGVSPFATGAVGIGPIDPVYESIARVLASTWRSMSKR